MRILFGSSARSHWVCSGNIFRTQTTRQRKRDRDRHITSSAGSSDWWNHILQAKLSKWLAVAWQRWWKWECRLSYVTCWRIEILWIFILRALLWAWECTHIYKGLSLVFIIRLAKYKYTKLRDLSFDKTSIAHIYPEYPLNCNILSVDWIQMLAFECKI